MIAYTVATFYREYVRSKGKSKPIEEISLHPYEIAYLNGGSDMVLQAALSYLVLKEVVTIEDSKLKVTPDPIEKLSLIHNAENSETAGRLILSDSIRDIEIKLCTSIQNRTWQEVGRIKYKFKKDFETIRLKLVEEGLAMSPQKESRCKLVMILFFLVPPLCFGMPRIIETFSTHRPVSHLAWLTLFSFGLPFIVTMIDFVRTTAGENYINDLKKKNMGLRQSLDSLNSPVSAEDLTLAVGVFGPTMLMAGAFSGLNMFFAPGGTTGSSNSSSDSSCSFFGSCGSSCGGGCGGCGGGCGGCGG